MTASTSIPSSFTSVGTAAFSNIDANEPWMLAEDIPDMDFFFSQIWLKSFVNNLSNACGKNYQRVFSIYRGYHQQFYFGQKDAHDFAKHLLAKLKADPVFGDTINQNIIRLSDDMAAHALSLQKADFSGQQNADLWAHYAEHVRRHTLLYEWGWLPNAVDMFYPEFTDHLKAILRGKAESEEQVNTWFVALTTSEKETIASQEHRDLLRLAIRAQTDDALKKALEKGDLTALENGFSSFMARAKAVHQNYRHLAFMYHGAPAKLQGVLFSLEPLLNDKKDLGEELRRLENLPVATRAAKARLMDELELSEKHRHLFSVFAEFMYTKWHRRNAQILSLFCMEPLLKEIAKRIGVTLQNVRTMTWTEVESALKTGKADGAALDARFSLYALYAEKGRDAVLEGSDAEAIERKAKTMIVDHSLTELKGQTACLGKAVGTVKILHGAKDLPKMQKGDILVAIATDPDIVPAMKIAAAIVTEQGGVTSHAAIVSRELNVPCVIGTKIATKWLKDGDRVEVDATKGVVRKV